MNTFYILNPLIVAYFHESKIENNLYKDINYTNIKCPFNVLHKMYNVLKIITSLVHKR